MTVPADPDRPSPGRPLGRRPGDPETTRASILAAARHRFADVGYDRATIRSIADVAHVDPALLIHRFGSKHELFLAAHELRFDPAELLAGVGDLPPSERGTELVRRYLTVMESPSSAALSLFRSAATNADAARLLREFVTASIVRHAPELAPGPDGARRLALAGAHLIGVVFGRVVIGLEPLASASLDDLAHDVGPVVQRYLDGAG